MPIEPGKSELKVEYSSRVFTVPKNLEYEFVIYEREMDYTFMYSKANIIRYLRSLHDVVWWNTIMCVSVLAAIVMVMVEDYNRVQPNLYLVDAVFNLLYAVHVVAVAFIIYHRRSRVTMIEIVGFIVDALTFTHYLVVRMRTMRLIVYCARLHRPLQYQWSNSNYNIKSSIWGTAFKIGYLNFVLRIGWTVVWIYVHEINAMKSTVYSLNISHIMKRQGFHTLSEDAEVEKEVTPKSIYTLLQNYTLEEFHKLYFQINRMYIPVGVTMDLSADIARVLCVLVQMSGCLMLAGAAVATLSLVFSIFLAPEEDFRSRYRLIIKEMVNSRVSPALREKVETFYMIYWKKYNAVSTADLMPVLPPTLTAAINFDIYFEATQKSRMLRDTPNHFLSEVMKVMTTIHYIPGDTIIGRGSPKHSMYFITYGDIEMLTAEDDSTAVLRMSRGTVLSPCSTCTVVACGHSHVSIRAATFCTAQVLSCPRLWKRTLRQGKHRGRASYLLWAFHEHLDKVKIHYSERYHPEVQHLSSIKAFKKGLIALKNARDSNGQLLMPREDVFLEIAGCYITRSDIESTMTDESDAICLRQRFPCIFQASSSLLDLWHCLVAILTVIVTITHPYNMAFCKEKAPEFFYFDRIVSIVYCIDLIIFLSTGANVEEGVVITLTQTALCQIRQPRFVVDVLATIPVFELIYNGHFGGINKLLKIPQLFHAMKNVEDNCVYHSHVLRFCTFTVLVVLVCYLMAFIQQAMMCFGFGYCEVKNFTHSPYWARGEMGDDVAGRVMFNLFSALKLFTLTNHMFVYVKNAMMETLYAIAFLELAMCIRILIEASYSATIMVTSALRQNFDSFINTVKDFLVRKEIDPLLQHRFITYLQLCWYTDNAYSITHEKLSIFYDLPPHVYQDIVAKQRSSYLLCIPFMKLLHREELRSIASRARLFYTSPNEILLNTGDFTDELFIIKQGIIEVLCPITRNAVKILKSKNHFASLECLLRFPAYYTFRAVTHVQIMSVKRRLFYKRCHDVPQIKEEFAALQQHMYRSFATYHIPPVPPNRQIFKQRRKFEQDFEFLVPFTQLGFLSVLRYVFPRFTIRPDSKYLERYEWFRAMCALLSSIVFPSYEYMQLQFPEIKTISRLLDMAAYFDMVQRTIIGYYNERGILIYHPSSTLAHYLRGAFIVDLIACVPLEHLEPTHTLGENYHLDMLRQGLMLNRLLQLYRFFQTIEALHVYLRQDIMLVLKSLPLFTTLVNVLTMFIVLSSANIVYPKGGMRGRNQTYWIVPMKDPGGSWIELFSGTYRFNITENVANFHLAVYFWVVYEATSTGYGTINPTNVRIMEVLFVGLIISSMISMYFSVRVISVRSNINVALCSFQEHKKDMQVYMAREKLDDNLKKLVRNYYDFNWDNMAGVETRSLLKLCDQVSLRTDCILHIYGSTFHECPILPNNDMSLMRVISRCIRDAYFVKKMEIMITDDVIQHMYFVSRGTVHIRISGKSMCKIIKLNRGSVFGTFDKIASRCPWTAVANTNIHLLQIKSKLFQDITKDCPTVSHLMAKFRPQKEMYICTVSKDGAGQRRVKRKTLSTINVTEAVQTKFRTEDVRVLVVLACITYGSMSADIYNISFQINTVSMIGLLYSLDILFLLKIALLVWVPNSKDAHKFRALRTKYLKTDFPYDLMSSIPFELFSFLLSPTERWVWFSWMRIGRMFRVITLYKCLRRRRKKLSTNLAVSTVITVAVWFSFSVHCIACMFYYVGTIEDHLEPRSSWRYNSKGQPLCNNEYICTMYFIMTTFTHNGVGDIMPGKHSEVIIVAILEIISTMMYMVFVGEFSNIVQYESYRSFTFYSQFLQLKEYLENNRVSVHLIDMIRQYCLHLWRESRGYQLPHFLTNAPLPLKLQVMTAAYLHHLDRHPVFRHCEPAFLRQLTGCLKMFTYNEDLMIVKENEITDSMYFIHQGTIQESSDKEGIMRIYVTREYFGEFQGLNRNEPYRHSYQSVHKSQVLMLQLDDWEYLLEHFPRSRAAIYGGPIPYDDRGDGGDDLVPDTSAAPKKTESISKVSDVTMRQLSSMYSIASRVKVQSNYSIRFTSSKEDVDNEEDQSTDTLVAPPSPPSPTPTPPQQHRMSIRFPFSSRGDKHDNREKKTGIQEIIKKLKGSKRTSDSDETIDAMFSDANIHSGNTFIPETLPSEFKYISESKSSTKESTPKASISKLKTGTVHDDNESMPETVISTKFILPNEKPGPSNRQVVYVRHDDENFSAKSKIAKEELKRKESKVEFAIVSNNDEEQEEENDAEIKRFIEELVQTVIDDVFKVLGDKIEDDIKIDDLRDSEERFEVFTQGKAFATEDKNIVKTKESPVVAEENESFKDDMVEIFMDSRENEALEFKKGLKSEDVVEIDENARIKAFAASQATLDHNKGLFHPKININRDKNTKNLQVYPKPSQTDHKTLLDEKNKNTFDSENKGPKIDSHDINYLYDKNEKTYADQPIISSEIGALDVDRKGSDLLEVKVENESDVYNTEINEESDKNYRDEGGDNDEKFEVFVQGRAFGKGTKTEKVDNDDEEERTFEAQESQPDELDQDRGEVVEVFVQGKAFEKSKESKNQNDLPDQI